MSFTQEELAAMAAADAEIEAEFFLTNEEAAASSARDREARYLTMDKRGQAVAEYQRRYREANKEAVAEYKRRYREANKEAVAEYKRRYYEANKEAVAERQRRYYEANKEKWKQYAAAKKAKKAARGGKPTDGAPEKPA